MKLKNEITIPVRNMRDGQIGVIIEWYDLNQNIGKIIQRHNDSLVCLQERWVYGASYVPQDDNTRVRILQKGEILIIE